MNRKHPFFLYFIAGLFLSCSATKVAQQTKRTYNVTYVIQTQCTAQELINLQTIVTSLPNKEQLSLDNLRFYRGGTTVFHDYNKTDINYSDDVFSKEIKTTCGTDIQLWFECVMKNYPFRKDFTRIFIYSSVRNANISYLNGITQNYKVFYTTAEMQHHIDSCSKYFSDKENIVLLHYFSKNISDETLCDTFKEYLRTHREETTPMFEGTNNISAVAATKNSAVNVYEFRWNKISGFTTYELSFDTLTFRLTPGECEEGNIGTCLLKYGAFCKERGNTIVCYINEDFLGEKCVLGGYGKNSLDKDCADCRNSCIYEKKGKWQIKVRGYSCGVFGMDSEAWKLQLKCAHSVIGTTEK